jgi:uncharacterized Zn-finger protein
MGERWACLALIEDESLMCDTCESYFKHGTAYLYLDVNDELVETMCEACWKKEGKE